MLLFQVLKIYIVKRHHSDLLGVTFLLLGKDLLFEVVDIHLMHSSLLDLLYNFLDTFHALLQVFEKLIG